MRIIICNYVKLIESVFHLAFPDKRHNAVSRQPELCQDG